MANKYVVEVRLHGGHCERLGEAEVELFFSKSESFPIDRIVSGRIARNGLLRINAQEFSRWEHADEISVGEEIFIVNNLIATPVNDARGLTYSVYVMTE